MPDTIWPKGTDSSQTLRESLRDYLKAYLKTAPINALLPRQFVTVLLEGEKQTAGIFVIIATEADNEQSWPFKSGNQRVLEVPHKIALIVKADAKAGGSASVLAVHSVLSTLIYDQVAAAALLALGIQNISETPEGLEVEGGNDEEGVFFQRQIDWKCTTDTYL